MKKAFTLIELIMVIVILGILSTIATDIYTNMYTNYASSKVVNELETETEVILEQISARLSDRIRPATIGRITEKNTKYEDGLDDIAQISDGTRLTGQHDVLEWLGESSDSKYLSGKGINNFSSSVGWSGYLDLYQSSANLNQIYSPGSHFGIAGNIINTLIKSKEDVAVIFNGLIDQLEWHEGYGFGGAGDINRVMIVDLGDKNEILDNNIRYAQTRISEKYQLSHTAYAIVPEDDEDGKTNLYLYYNYKPWLGQRYSDGSKTLLAKNIYLFRFRGIDSTIDLKLCLKDDSGLLKKDFIVCKTKAVF